jgi:hypothetical protein
VFVQQNKCFNVNNWNNKKHKDKNVSVKTWLIVKQAHATSGLKYTLCVKCYMLNLLQGLQNIKMETNVGRSLMVHAMKLKTCHLLEGFTLLLLNRI